MNPLSPNTLSIDDYLIAAVNAAKSMLSNLDVFLPYLGILAALLSLSTTTGAFGMVNPIVIPFVPMISSALFFCLDAERGWKDFLAIIERYHRNGTMLMLVGSSFMICLIHLQYGSDILQLVGDKIEWTSVFASKTFFLWSFALTHMATGILCWPFRHIYLDMHCGISGRESLFPWAVAMICNFFTYFPIMMMVYLLLFHCVVDTHQHLISLPGLLLWASWYPGFLYFVLKTMFERRGKKSRKDSKERHVFLSETNTK